MVLYHRVVVGLPKVIFLDAPNGIHASNLSSHTNQLHPNVRSDLDDLIFIICKLWRRSIGIISNVLGYKLAILSVVALVA
jgi:hypothetical protein